MKNSTQIMDAAIAMAREMNSQPAREVIESFRDNLTIGSGQLNIVRHALAIVGKRDQFLDMDSLRRYLTEVAASPDQNFVLALHRAAATYEKE